MIVNEEVKTTLGGLNMDRISSPSGEVLWMKPKVIFLEYLQSTGTQFIDTGYFPNENTGIKIKYECCFGSYVCGCRTDGSSFAQSKYFGVTNSSDTHIIHCRLNAVDISEGLNYTEGLIYEIDFNKNKCIINGSDAYYTGQTVPSYTSLYSMYLFNINYKGKSLPAWGNNKIYYVDIYDGETLVKSFRPCLYNGLLGMWELIEKKFYPNKGTGEFAKGKEIYQVRFVDYILSTGTLYINTGYKVNSNTIVETSFNYTYSSGETGYRGVFGCGNNYNTTDNFMASVHLGNNTAIIGYAGGANNLNVRLSDESQVLNKDITFKEKVSGMSIKDSSHEYNTINTGKTTIVNPTRSMYIFSTNTANGDLNGKHIKMKLYDFKIWDGLVLVRDFRPCIYTEDPWKTDAPKKVGLWDLVSHKFYGNAGTGEFTPGKNIFLFVDFIEATGTLFIRSNYTPNKNTSITAEWEYTDIHERAVYGNTFNQDTEIRVRGFRCLGGEGTALNSTYIASGGLRVYHPNNALSTGKLLTVHTGDTFTYNGTTIASGYDGEVFTPLMIAHDGFWDGTNESETHRQDWFKGKIYSFLIKDGNVPLRDYRPCIYKDKEGLWDMVYDRFYGNDGTGEFLTNLDYIPKFIPYIKSSGTQYIDTGIIPTFDYTVECKAAKDVEHSIFGSGLYGYVFTGAEGKNYIYLGGTSRNSRANVNVNDPAVHTWGIKNRKGYVDGVAKTATVSLASTTAPNNTLYLFCRNNGGALSDAGSHTIYYCKIWDNEGNLIRNLRPCIYKKKLGLWDLVEGKFYENKGTGDFIYTGTEWSYDLSTIDNNYFNTIFITSNTVEDTIEDGNLTITGDIQDTYSDNNLTITI